MIRLRFPRLFAELWQRYVAWCIGPAVVSAFDKGYREGVAYGRREMEQRYADTIAACKADLLLYRDLAQDEIGIRQEDYTR